MSIQEAKTISIEAVFRYLGYHPVHSHRGGIELQYFSPFRSEKEPSLFVNTKKNVWNDFGHRGGNILDFVMLHEQTDISGALKFLQKFEETNFKPNLKQKNVSNNYSSEKQIKALKIVEILPLDTKAPSLVHYLFTKRKIPKELASLYLSEIHFKNTINQKQYFAVGFPNLSGGYELRNPYFKGAVEGKDLSFVEGKSKRNELIIFEGFMDFLSRLAVDDMLAPERDCLILNTAVYAKKAIQFIEKNNYKTIFGFFDNDEKGEELTAQFTQLFGDKFKDIRFIYKDKKDLNDTLKALKNKEK